MKVGSLVRYTERTIDGDFQAWRETYFGIVTWLENSPMVEIYWIKDKYKCVCNVKRLEVLCK